jgi:putative transposase
VARSAALTRDRERNRSSRGRIKGTHLFILDGQRLVDYFLPMPRGARHTPGGYVFHALNRGTAQLKLFRKHADYQAFLGVFDEALQRHPIRVLGYCVMPTHWHFVLWPAADGEVTAFLRWLTLTHSVRWHKHHQSTGSGHLYQNRFKAFPVGEDDHLLTVLRYVERNALRAGLVRRAEDWPWSSLACRMAGGDEAARRLHAGPLVLPDNWRQCVNEAHTEAELEALRLSVARGRPYGSAAWVTRVVKRLGLESTVRPRGRPRQQKTARETNK